MAIEYNYEIGKQVVCIAGAGNWPDNVGFATYKGPTKGQILTIRNIKDYRPMLDTLGLQFVEFRIQTVLGFDATFACEYFRPVKDTSIETFNRILEKLNQGGNVPVANTKKAMLPT